MDRTSRDIRYRRVLAGAMVLSLVAHGALFALGEFGVAPPFDDGRSVGETQDDRAWSETPLEVVQLGPAPPDRGARGEAAPSSDAAATASEARRLELPAPSPTDGVATAVPMMKPVASDRSGRTRVVLTATADARADPAVRAFRARMEARDDQLDYRPASRAARQAAGDRDGDIGRGRYVGRGPGCGTPRGGGTDRSPFPVGGGPRR